MEFELSFFRTNIADVRGNKFVSKKFYPTDSQELIISLATDSKEVLRTIPVKELRLVNKEATEG